MKKSILFIVLFALASLTSYSQIIFEKGYFINESNQKIACFIKNVDWRNNPSEFEYKLSQESASQQADIQGVKEFAIDGTSKYVRSTVKIDRSSDEISNLSTEKSPNFQEETLFLEALIEGKASLYMYKKGNLTRFFYKGKDSTMDQLVYRRYLSEGNSIAQNNFYRQQLFNGLSCPGIPSSIFENINYNQRALEKLFIRYNECTNSSSVSYRSEQKKDLFNLSLRAGLNYSNLKIQNPDADPEWSVNFGDKPSFRFGIESEFILPFNKNKWGILFEATYQYYESEKTTNYNKIVGGAIVSKANYGTFELPVGIRHYFFINDKSKIFLNGSYSFVLGPMTHIVYNRSDGSNIHNLYSASNAGSFVFGLGYKHNDKFSFETRYQTRREILGNYLIGSSDYQTLSLIMSYSLF